MALFGTDWRDPNRYDVVLNMGKMHREGGKRLVVEAAKLDEYQPTAASSQAFENLALGSRVHATLFASPGVRGTGLEVRADRGDIHVTGRVDEGAEELLVNIVRRVPGVSTVTTDVYSVPPEGF
jgi:osmotically-inducible protein OsmY